MMAAVFSMQGFGQVRIKDNGFVISTDEYFQLGGAIIMLIVTAGFKESLITAKSYATCQGVCGLAVDKMWRVLVGE